MWRISVCAIRYTPSRSTALRSQSSIVCICPVFFRYACHHMIHDRHTPFALCVPRTNITRRFSNLTLFLPPLSRNAVYCTVLSILRYVSFFNAQAALPHCLEYLRLAAHYHPVLELSSWVSHFNQLVSDLAARLTQEAWPQLSWPPTLACIVQSQNATVSNCGLMVLQFCAVSNVFSDILHTFYSSYFRRQNGTQPLC